MLDYLDGVDLYNTLRLLLAGRAGKMIVVEGGSDYILLEEALEQTGANLHAGYGKTSLLEAAVRSEADGIDSLKFLVDADFDRVTSAADGFASNVVATEYYDLVVDVALELPELLPRISRLNCARDEGTTSHEDQVKIAWRVAAEVGGVRYASEARGWNLNLSKFPVHNFIPTTPDGEINRVEVVRMSIIRTGACELSHPEAAKDLDESLAELADPRVLVNGHDLLSALNHVNRTLGSARAKTDYESQFVLAAAGHVAQVAVVRDLADWARAA